MIPKRLLSKLAAFDRAERLLAPGDKVLAAVSGGPDSVCLAHHLGRLARRKGLSVVLVHMDHGLRRSAARDAAFVAGLARKLGLPLVLRRLPVSRTAARERRSLEDAGRKLRYRTLASLARRLGARKVATGHHLDDLAETLILHLLRGTRAKGLAGIPPARRLEKGITLVRPLLALTRAEVLAYLEAFGLDWREDETNRSLEFTRNWVRHEALPFLEKKSPRLREHLAALSADIRKLTKGSGT